MRTVLIQGASTAAGWHDFEKGGWANRLSTDALAFNSMHTTEAINFQNDAIPGNTIFPILRDMERIDKFKKLGSVITILSVGLNELKIMNGLSRPQVTPKKFTSALNEYSEYLESRKVTPVYIGVEKLTDETIETENHNTFEADLSEEYNNILIDHAVKTGMYYIDLHNILDNSMVNTDGYHPNKYGHEVIAENIKDILSSLGLYRIDVDISGKAPHYA